MRLAGVLVGTILILFSVWPARRRRSSRGETLTWFVLGAGVVVFAAVPGAARPFGWALSLENRLFAVLVPSILVLFALRMADRARQSELEQRFGSLVRNLALRRFHAEHDVATHTRTIAVVIAAFNEETAIEGVLAELPRELVGYKVAPYVIVDGGSDDTEGVVRRSGYFVATHPVNRGQGDALRTGFRIAIDCGDDLIVTMDADGQHNPDDLVALVKPVIADEADYVQGSRFLGTYDDAGGAREIGIRMFTRLINLLSHAGITDATNGFRAIRTDKLVTLHLEEDRFSAPELIMESAAKGLRIEEVPVHIRTRSHGETKKPARLGYPIGFLRTIVRVWLR